MIKIENLSKYYSSNGVVSKGLESINLELNKGEFVAIVGESGSGKSTLLNVITQMDSYDDGEIYFNGEETSYFNEDDISEFKKNHVSVIFQNYNLLDSYTVLENVMLPMIIKGVSFKEAKIRAKELIEKVNLTKRINNKASHLSGGEKQRVSIARALASDTEILACDEATGNLDSKTREEIVNLLKEVCKDKLVLYVTHNYDEIKDVCTRTIYLKDNKIIKDEIKKNVKEASNLDVDFEYKPMKLKSNLLISLKNIFATPKKNFLIFSIILVMSMIFTLIINSMIAVAKTDVYYNRSNSPYNDENYVVFKGEEPLELKGKVLDNIELSRVRLNINSTMSGYFTPYDIYCNEFYGTRISDETPTNRCNIYLPYTYKYELDRHIESVEVGIAGLPRRFRVDGIGYSNNISSPMVRFNYQKTDFIEAEMYEAVCINTLKCFEGDRNFYTSFKIVDNNKPTIRIKSKDYKLDNIDLTYKDVSIIDDFEWVVDKNCYDNMIVELSTKYLDSLEDEKSFYTNKKSELNYNLNLLKKNNIRYYIPFLDREADVQVRVTIVITILILIVPFIFFFIFTRLILKRVYQSKIKEYSIIRILGVNNKDMQKMIITESFLVTLVSMFLGYFTIIGILNLIPRFRGTMIAAISPLPFIVFFIIMIVFSLMLSTSFSKLLYKESSIKTLKEEAL